MHFVWEHDLNTLATWSNDIRLEFNIIILCHLMSFYINRVLLKFTYSLSGVVLANLGNPVNDLGVLFDRNLSFNAHIQASFRKALKTRNFKKNV